MDLNKLIFKTLNKTNKALFIYDHEHSALNNFKNTYKFIGQLLVIGKSIDEVPLKWQHSITYIDVNVESAYLDGSLNGVVDLIYVDFTKPLTSFSFNMLKQCIDVTTTSIVFKVLPEVSEEYLNSLKNKGFVFEYYETETEGYLVHVP